MKLQLEVFFGLQARLKHEKDVIKKLDMLENKDGSRKSNMLDQVYDEIYNNNTDEDSWSQTAATRAFKWMMCAQRSLSVWELAEAASMNDDETKDSLTSNGLLQICSNFIISDESGIAQFSHDSVREYLERREIDNDKEYSSEKAHIQAALTCLICLSDPRNPLCEVKKLN